MEENVITIIGGSFNDSGGKPSGWVSKFAQSISSIDGINVKEINGGTFEFLARQLFKLPKEGVVCWFADVPNDKPKMVKEIKKMYPKLLLVTSKRNLNGEYSFQDLISRALEIKSNLTIEFTGDRSNVKATIMDPLGNVFITKESDISKVAVALVKRIVVLLSVERIGSRSVGAELQVSPDGEILRFIEIVKGHADKFHELIHGTNTTRMLGNASFRCERGFPSFRRDYLIYVSRRNIDKRFIGPEAFVAVRGRSAQTGIEGDIEYFGESKPSVDTPVQLALYYAYQQVNWMLHSHTYIEGAPFTKDILPCGAVEEVYQIWKVNPNYEASNFAVNIRGHGSICLASSLDFLESVKWVARPIPEIVEDM